MVCLGAFAAYNSSMKLTRNLLGGGGIEARGHNAGQGIDRVLATIKCNVTYTCNVEISMGIVCIMKHSYGGGGSSLGPGPIETIL